MIDEATLLRHIARQPKQQAGFKQLVRELRVRGDDRGALGEVLLRLARAGKLKALAKERFAIPQAAHHAGAGRNLISGRISMHRDGYGFVAPADARLREQLQGDIYIAPRNAAAAMDGDQVQVEIEHRKADGRAEGRVVRIARRAHATVVGKFHHSAHGNHVTPMDEKIAQEIVIPPGMEAPQGRDKTSRSEEDAHRVVGSEARRNKAGYARDLEGLVVDVEITQWPGPTQAPRGRVVEVLGDENDFGVDTEIIIRKHHIPHRFPPEALEEARQCSDAIGAEERHERRNFRELPIVTIDGETARDFDDAVFARRQENGSYELQVHIADVAHYVREGSAMDGEARERGTSVYFPDRAVPMLPVELSTDICSLRQGVDRLVMSCLMQVDPRGEITGYELCAGVIHSAARMTYSAVHSILQGDAALRKQYAALVTPIETMDQVATLLNRKRMRRGSIDFDLPEPVIEFDEQGTMRGVVRSERNQAHRLIEEFMLSANECVASYLEERHIASLYRIHEKPDAKRVYEFEAIAAGFGYSLGVGAIPITRHALKPDHRGRQSRGHGGRGRDRQRDMVEIPHDVHITPRMYQKLAEKIAGKPEERILSFLMLRSLKQARYSEQNLGHFALAAPSYTHFTSPIRRYPDLVVHRILKDVLAAQAERRDGEVAVGVGHAPAPKAVEPASAGKKKPPAARAESSLGGPLDEAELHEIAEHSSETERRADDAERELVEWKKVKFMAEHVGEELDGLVVSVTKFGLFIELNDLFIEGLAPIAGLPGDRYFFREQSRQIVGEHTHRVFALGQRVKVLVERIDWALRKVQFAMVEERSLAPRAKAGGGRHRQK